MRVTDRGCRTGRGWLAAAGFVAVFLAPPMSARAELCDPATKICIVNPPSAAAPWIPPQLVQLRLPAEAEPEYSGASWSQPGQSWSDALRSGAGLVRGGLQLLEQGMPGGTSLYQGILEARYGYERPSLPTDGALTLSVVAGHRGSNCTCIEETKATFSELPVLSPIGRFNWRIVRSGKFFQAVMSLEARSAVQIKQLFYISAFDGEEYDFLPLPLMQRKVTGSGSVRVVQRLSARYVQNQCAAYRRCMLWADAKIGPGGEPLGASGGLLESVSRPVVIHRHASRSRPNSGLGFRAGGRS